jgi:biotin carboxyl carrier protein
MTNEFIYKDDTFEPEVKQNPTGAEVTIGDNSYKVSMVSSGKFIVETEGAKKTVCCVLNENKSYLDIDGLLIELAIQSDDDQITGGVDGQAGEKDKIYAPMPGKIVKLLVKEGDEVKEKQPMVIVEAMKMENQVNAMADGKVKRINFSDGDQVDTETPIIELDIE